MPQSHVKLRMICLALVLLLFPAIASAQSDLGRISGSVKDQNGAIVPGAEANVTNDRTGDERTGTTNAQGNFSVAGLRASTYTVTATTSGLSATLSFLRPAERFGPGWFATLAAGIAFEDIR